MSMVGDPADPVGPGGQAARVVLDADGLDALELVIGGALPDLPRWLQGEPGAVLTDSENRPVGQLEPVADVRGGRRVLSLRPLPHGVGPPWEPEVRRSADAVRADLAATIGQGRVLAVVVDRPPSLADIRALAERAERDALAGIVLVVPIARGDRNARSGGHVPVSQAGLVRATRSAAEDLRHDLSDRTVVPLVMPWPRRDIGPVEAVLAAYGATDTARLGDLGEPGTIDPLTDLRRHFEDEIRAAYPPASADEILAARSAGRSPAGAVVFFTGLSGSGKSTIARSLADDLEDRGRQVTLLDGDAVRQHLSAELGFDPVSRERNIDRIAYVASLVAAHGGIAIAAPIAPFAAGRAAARRMIEPVATFLLVHVDTPLDVCEARDLKGLYAQARAGKIADFTGIGSPYEAPDDADAVIETVTTPVEAAVSMIRRALDDRLARST